jgi:hypothetical protein
MNLLHDDFPDVRTDSLLYLVKTHGLPDVMKSLELLKSIEPVAPRFVISHRPGEGTEVARRRVSPPMCCRIW